MALLITAVVALPAASAWANTAANTRIINDATLSYNDSTGPKTATAQVTVIVALKAAIPTITPVSDKFGPYANPLTDDYVLTNNANGPDTFILTTAANTVVNGTITPVPDVPVLLGATVTVAGSNTNVGLGRTYILVPADGVSNSSINEIVVGDVIVINNIERVVRAIVDNASGISTIEVDALPADPVAGVLVSERTTVHATVTPSGVTDPALNVTGNVKMTATSVGDATQSAQSTNLANTFYPYTGSLTKYVRNFDTNVGSGTINITFNTKTYYKDGPGYDVKAKPGETLEYLLLATAVIPTQPLTNAVLTDLVPTGFVTVTPGAYGGKAFRYYPDSSNTATVIDYSSTNNDDAVNYNPAFSATKGEIKAWIGGAAPAYNTPGTIDGGKSIILLYQVKVNP